MEEIELRSLILRGEDSTLQFKRQIDSCEKLAPEIVAFLNARGGRILIGVADDGRIHGLSPGQVRELNQIISSTAKDHVMPTVSVDTSNVPTSEGLVVVLTVEEGIDKPYQTRKGEFWIKAGSDKRHVTHRDELRRLFQIGSHVYAERTMLRSSDLGQLDLLRYRNYYETLHRKPAPTEAEELIAHMRSLNLVKGDHLTLAGALLFATHPEHLVPQFGTKAVWFLGMDISSSHYEDERSITGTLPDMYREAMDFLKAWNMRTQAAGATFNEQSVPLVDPIVFQEILTNAYVYRDYFIQDSIKIFIFDDRIEIHSPGTLPNSLTLDEALNGIRRERNPVIQSIGLTLMEYRGVGSGLVRAQKAHPGIQFDNNLKRNAFIVTIPVS
ncbi:MAG: putative DNA binding domain-containing protein [Opitutaceae bacterium]|jgi:ATP-dependent DNA helicase RecG|nr:putative DNA binding domain-containing protein [Opitutaceae bacterium]